MIKTLMIFERHRDRRKVYPVFEQIIYLVAISPEIRTSVCLIDGVHANTDESVNKTRYLL